MGGRLGVIRSAVRGRRSFPWIIGLLVVLIGASVTSFLLRPVPASAPDIRSLLAGVRQERSSARPYLGITYQELSARTDGHSGSPAIGGAVIASIVPGSPAAMGGLRTGDVILAVDGEALGRDNTLLNVLLKHQSGDRVRLMVQRAQEHLSLEILVGKQ